VSRGATLEDQQLSGGGRRGGRGLGRPAAKVLCVSNIHPKASDEQVRETLYREFERFGEPGVRLLQEQGERIAYLFFQTAGEAREAEDRAGRVTLMDRATVVEGVPQDWEPPRSPPRSRYRDQQGWHHQPGPPPGPHRRGREDGGAGRGGRDEFRGPPPGWQGENYGGAVSGPGRRENKKDRFPNYLDHLPPEQDPLATRTLFAGNLELGITEEEMKRIFNRYGRLVDIDIKRPPPGTGNAYAFLRFENLDQSAAAKRELSGQYIGKFQCKIGYGKVVATSKVWVGGLGPWCGVQLLQREFDRFGTLSAVEYEPGDTEATLQYGSVEAASAAVAEMRGFPLGGPDHCIRLDYSDEENMPASRGYQGSDYDPAIARGRGRGYYHGGPGGGRGSYRGGYQGSHQEQEWEEEGGNHIRNTSKLAPRSPDPGRDSNTTNSGLTTARSVAELARRLEQDWEGGLILKNSLFPVRLLPTEAESGLAALLVDEKDRPHLRISQRLRLDPARLEEVSQRMASGGNAQVFLGLPGKAGQEQGGAEQAEVQSRPLRNLVTYLKQKEAAGVISLPAGLVLYAFPPCQFSTGLLRRVAANLSDQANKEDHLVVVVVRQTPDI